MNSKNIFIFEKSLCFKISTVNCKKYKYFILFHQECKLVINANSRNKWWAVKELSSPPLSHEQDEPVFNLVGPRISVKITGAH